MKKFRFKRMFRNAKLVNSSIIVIDTQVQNLLNTLKNINQQITINQAFNELANSIVINTILKKIATESVTLQNVIGPEKTFISPNFTFKLELSRFVIWKNSNFEENDSQLIEIFKELIDSDITKNFREIIKIIGINYEYKLQINDLQKAKETINKLSNIKQLEYVKFSHKLNEFCIIYIDIFIKDNDVSIAFNCENHINSINSLDTVLDKDFTQECMLIMQKMFNNEQQ